jgi:acyl-CoA dehydrogenase
LQQRLAAFMEEHVVPAEERFEAEMDAHRAAGNPLQPAPVMEAPKAKAREAGMWNLCATPTHSEPCHVPSP